MVTDTTIFVHTRTQVKPARQAWHYADGAIYLARELCIAAPLQTAALLPVLADVARLTHFPQADTLRETIWHALPLMTIRIGKNAFKQHLQEVLEPLFTTLTRPTTQQLAGYAAVDCVQQLAVFVGRGIFMAGLTAEQAAVMKRLPIATTTATAPAQVCLPYGYMMYRNICVHAPRCTYIYISIPYSYCT